MSVPSIVSSVAASSRHSYLDTPGDAAAVSLEQRLLQAFADSTVQNRSQETRINHLVERADINDPGTLAEIQRLTGDYAVDVSLINAMVRKGVSTVETLLRSS